jgi:hypothetical protein
LLLAVATFSLASGATFTASFVEPVVVNGKALKAGDYEVEVKESSVIIAKGKKPQVEAPAKIENAATKFGRTQVLYSENKGKFSLKQIELGGTTTRLVFPAGK